MSRSSNERLISNALFNLKGRVALVTGAGTGIGLMITQALAVNGAKVYITGRTEEKLQKVADQYKDGIDGEIIPIVADVSKKEDIAKLYKDISSREKCLCVLVNNAGIDSGSFETEAKTAEELKKNLFDANDATFEAWTDVYRTNVAAIYFMSTAFAPLLQKASEVHTDYSGTIINIASISGMVKDPQHHFDYNSSKGAALHLTRMLANTFAENKLKIRVNAISPGVFPSEMTTDESGSDQKSFIPKEKFEDKVPAARPGKEEDMAKAVIHFVVNQYVNGENLAVDGGYTLAAGM